MTDASVPIDERDDRTGPTTVGRVVALLEAVATSEARTGVRALARQSGIDKSAVSRMLRQLSDLDMLEQTDDSGRYQIGPRFFAIAAAIASRDELWKAARPILERLVERYDETSYLAVRERDEVLFRERVECRQPIRYVIDLNRPSPLHAGSAGRAILSTLSDEEFERLVGRNQLQPVTPHTITDSAELRRLRDEDRRRGYTVSVAERSVGGCGLASPFFGNDGRCRGSLVMTMPHVRFELARVEEWGQAVRGAARELSVRLGYTPIDERSAPSDTAAR
jgi:DNA-binding IclR family transcriptional regulator